MAKSAKSAVTPLLVMIVASALTFAAAMAIAVKREAEEHWGR